jgi:hypothetical protein
VALEQRSHLRNEGGQQRSHLRLRRLGD